MNIKGYGLFDVWGHSVTAHRFSWYVFNGEVFDANAVPVNGQFILHHCDNKRCVNPAHLYMGSAAENNMDIIDRSRRTLLGLTRETERQVKTAIFGRQGSMRSSDR